MGLPRPDFLYAVALGATDRTSIPIGRHTVCLLQGLPYLNIIKVMLLLKMIGHRHLK